MINSMSDSIKIVKPTLQVYWNSINIGVASEFEIKNTVDTFDITSIAGYTHKVPTSSIQQIFFSLTYDYENFIEFNKNVFKLQQTYQVGDLRIRELIKQIEGKQYELKGDTILYEAKGMLLSENIVMDENYGYPIYRVHFKFTAMEGEIKETIYKAAKIIEKNDFVEKPKKTELKKKDEKIYKRKISF